MTGPRIVYEHSADEEIEGDVIDGMEAMMGDDITGSDYEVGTEWPGVPNVPHPPWFDETT